MLERRTDYILDRTVLVSSHRAERPDEYDQRAEREHTEPCVFCPGKEDQTPNDIGRRTDDNGQWQVRWFPNEFPAVNDNKTTFASGDSYFTPQPAYGHHEVIVETRDHDRQMADLSNHELTQVFDVYADRIQTLYSKDKMEAVTVFKNQGPHSGASIHHAHSQVIATDFVPVLLKKEQEAVSGVDYCPFCRVIDNERNSQRFCFENNEFMAFTPYASRHEYELWMFPRSHVPSLTQLDPAPLVPLLKRALTRLGDIDASFNFVLHDDPTSESYHAHLELYPRTGSWGGFERGTNTMINPVPPEQAAAFYREDDDGDRDRS